MDTIRAAYLTVRQWVAARIVDPLMFHFDRVRVRHRDLRRFSHLVASREGLYAADVNGFVKVLGGQFYGLTVRGTSIFCFQANDLVWSRSRRGRILELELEGGVIRRARVRAKGLDNGCHQIDFIGDDLYVTDTYNQQILRLDPTGTEVLESFQPLPPAPKEAWDEGYAHINSIVRQGDELFLLASNGGLKTGKRSEVLRCNLRLEVLERFALPGLMCHNLLFLEDGTLISCGSTEGAVIHRDGVLIQVGEMMTRGLSVDDGTLVVGDSYFTVRHRRRYAPGNVFFYDREHRLLARHSLPAAPTEIRRIDGRDLSLSSFRNGFEGW